MILERAKIGARGKIPKKLYGIREIKRFGLYGFWRQKAI